MVKSPKPQPQARDVSEAVTIAVNDSQAVSGLLLAPTGAKACYVLAHGAGAGMQHPFMAKLAQGLAMRDIATLRYQFPYMERGAKLPDRAPLAQTAVRAAVMAAGERLPDLPLFAGGKSFGARMTSQAQAEKPLPRVLGLVFLGFPLHPSGKPSTERAAHLHEVRIPMLFLQGGRDTLADKSLITGVVDDLGETAMLELIDHADHSLHVPARSGETDDQVLDAALDVMTRWMERTAR